METTFDFDVGSTLTPVEDQPYLRLGVIPKDQLIPFIINKQAVVVKGLRSPIDVSSIRMQTYAHGTKCAISGVDVAYFAVETQKHILKRIPMDKLDHSGLGYHFNAYAIVDGKEVMMTSDHIIPKSTGIREMAINRQPMLQSLNGAKQNIMSEQDVKEAIRRQIPDYQLYIPKEFA